MCDSLTKLSRVEPAVKGTRNARRRAATRASATGAMYQSYVHACLFRLLDPTGSWNNDPIHPIARATLIQSIQKSLCARDQTIKAIIGKVCKPCQRKMSQAEALWESKSQIAGLACQDIRYKGPVYQTVRQNKNNNQSTHKIRINERSPSRATENSQRDTDGWG